MTSRLVKFLRRQFARQAPTAPSVPEARPAAAPARPAFTVWSAGGVTAAEHFTAERPYTDLLSFDPPGPATGRALVSYLLVDPDRDDFDGHSNKWESAEVVRMLRSMGYAVDVINFRNQGFMPTSRYDIIFDIALNLQRLRPFLDRDTLRLLHFTHGYTRHANDAEMRRVFALEARRGAVYTPKSLAPFLELFDRSLEFAHRVSLIGNAVTEATFPERYRAKITPITVSASRIAQPKGPRSYTPKAREFVWFFGVGAVRKGLDLVLEVFARRPDLTLNVAGRFAQEADFMQIYERELKHLPNIRLIGEMNPASEAFRALMGRCFAFVAPTSNEGISPAAATLMQYGLYPILSPDSGIDLPDGCGIWLETCSLDEIEAAVDRAFRMDAAELGRQIALVQAHAFERYSRERFSAEMRAYLDDAIADWRAGRFTS